MHGSDFHPDQDKVEGEQRFRASLITSVAAHLATVAVLVFGPLLFPRTVVMPDVLPVQVLPAARSEPQPPAPDPDPVEEEPQPEEPEEQEAEPEEVEPEPAGPTAEELRQAEIERQIELQRAEEEREREEEAARQRRAEEERRRREEEAERRRREEEERLRREEEARRQPQSAGRRPDPVPERQQARREGIDVTGTEETQTSFTVEDFPFAAYLLTIRDMVGARWDPPPRGEFAPELRAEVFFRIGRDGRLIVNPRILNDGSGNTIYDQAAMRAIAAAAPFPPLPREYEGTSLGVRFAFYQ